MCDSFLYLPETEGTFLCLASPVFNHG